MHPSGVQFGLSRGLLQRRGEEILLSDQLVETISLQAQMYVQLARLSVVTITDGEVITINEGKRSTGSGGRGIGIRVCVGRSVYPMLEKFQTERPAKNAGRASR